MNLFLGEYGNELWFFWFIYACLQMVPGRAYTGPKKAENIRYGVPYLRIEA